MGASEPWNLREVLNLLVLFHAKKIIRSKGAKVNTLRLCSFVTLRETKILKPPAPDQATLRVGGVPFVCNDFFRRQNISQILPAGAVSL
jgi:hypothetical protein